MPLSMAMTLVQNEFSAAWVREYGPRPQAAVLSESDGRRTVAAAERRRS